jgi:hypothetical protein
MNMNIARGLQQPLCTAQWKLYLAYTWDYREVSLFWWSGKLRYQWCHTYISYSYSTCWRDVGKMNTDFGNRQAEVRVKQCSARKDYVRCRVE